MDYETDSVDFITFYRILISNNKLLKQYNIKYR